MWSLERGIRKKGKKLYRIRSILNFCDPYYIWRTEIDVETRRILCTSGLEVKNVPKEKESQVFNK